MNLERSLLICGLAAVVVVCPAHAMEGTPGYDFDWVTISDPKNSAYEGGPFGQLAGRGSVDYLYRIGRFEVTSGQWLELLNTFGIVGDPHGFRFTSSDGIQQDFSYGGPGIQFKLIDELPNAAMIPVVGISWRKFARYVNWLHNDKAPTLEALDSGAYDTSTWGQDPDTNLFTDAATHEPGAKFWIPTIDEWLKAAHYDPNRYGAGQGGWWQYSNGSNAPLIAGPPGIGQTSAGYVAGPGELSEFFIPLGSYPEVQSPWGLLDVSGGAAEWTEDWLFPEFPRYRTINGAPAGEWLFSGIDLDLIYRHTDGLPHLNGLGVGGLRIASAAIPDVVVFEGVDPDATDAGGLVNATAAQAEFAAAVGTGLIVEDLESAMVGGGQQSFTVNDLTFMRTGGSDSGVLDSPESGEFPVSGTNYGFTNGQVSTFTFGGPIQAFGAYFTGIGDLGGVLVARFVDGSMQEIPMPNTGPGDSGGMFFGFTDFGKQILEVEILNAVITDSFGFDDVQWLASSGCFEVVYEQITCHADGTTFTVNIEGFSACSGNTTQVTITASGGAVGEEMCSTLLVDDGGFCCSTEICVTIPDCTGTLAILTIDTGDSWANSTIGAIPGHNVTTITAAGIGGIDFTLFDVLYVTDVPNSSTPTWAVELIARAPDIETYINGGGFVIVGVEAFGGDGITNGDEYDFLPSGLVDGQTVGTQVSENDVVITDPTHPLFDGINSADLSNWNWSYHGSLPLGSLPVLATNVAGQALIRGGGVGAGGVFVWSLDPDWHHFFFDTQGTLALVENAIGLVQADSPAMPGDLNGDGIVGITDFLSLLSAWGSCSDCGTCPADFDGDCSVGILDMLVLLGNWG